MSAATVVVGCLALLVTSATATSGRISTVDSRPQPTQTRFTAVPVPPATAGPHGEMPVTGLLVPPDAPAPPVVQTDAWVIADATSGQIIAAQNPAKPLAPASTLKALTLLTLLTPTNADQLYTATPEDAGIEGSKVGLTAGSVYRVKDLVHGLMLSSGNDCANALGAMVGGQAQAAALMQKKAHALGAVNTQVRNTSGLDDPAQVTTAEDLAIIAQAVLQRPDLAAIVKTRQYAFPGTGADFSAARPMFQISNHNKMLAAYPGTTGMKTGYTIASRHTFIGSAQRGSKHYIATLLHGEAQASANAQTLLDWAFALPPTVRPVGTLHPAPPTATQTQPPKVDTVSGEVDAGEPGVPWWWWSIAALLLVGTVAAGTTLWRSRQRRWKRPVPEADLIEAHSVGEPPPAPSVSPSPTAPPAPGAQSYFPWDTDSVSTQTGSGHLPPQQTSGQDSAFRH